MYRRDEVITTAENLFAQHGYHATSVRDIADALGIKAGSLYAHIATKEDLLWESLSQTVARYAEVINPIVRSERSVAERLGDAISALVEVSMERASATTVCRTEWRYLSEPRRGRFAAQWKILEDALWRLVRDGAAEGRFRSVDPYIAGKVILTSAVSKCAVVGSGDGRVIAEVGRKVADIFIHGLTDVGTAIEPSATHENSGR